MLGVRGLIGFYRDNRGRQTEQAVSQGVATLTDYSSQAAILAKRELLSHTSRQAPVYTQTEEASVPEGPDVASRICQAATLTKT